MRHVRGEHRLTSDSEADCAASPSDGLGYSLKLGFVAVRPLLLAAESSDAPFKVP